MDSKSLASEVARKTGAITCKYPEIHVKILLPEPVNENSHEFCHSGRHLFAHHNYMFSLTA